MQLKFGWATALGLALAGCGGGGGSEAPSAPAKTEAAGALDAAFGTQGVATVRSPMGSGSASVTDIAQAEDGGYIVGGVGPYLAKLTNDGRIDTSFATNGIDTQRRGTRTFQDVVKVAQLAGGSIMVVENHSGPCLGSPFFCALQSFADVVARRTNPIGTPDLAYGQQGLGTLTFSQGHIVVSPNGRVTSFTMRPQPVTPSVFGVASLDPAGIQDAAFEAQALASVVQCGSSAGLAATAVQSAAAAALGLQFVVATTWTRAEGGPLVCVSRLNADGSLDASFGTGGHQTFVSLPNAAPPVTIRTTLRAFRVITRDDGAIVVALSLPANSGSLDPPAYLFLMPSGAKDTSRLPSGMAAPPVYFNVSMSDMTVQLNGKIVDVGLNTAPGVPALPLLEERAEVKRSEAYGGVPDFGFGPFRGGFFPLQTSRGNLVPQKVFIDRTGAILVGGYMMGSLDGAVLRLQ